MNFTDPRVSPDQDRGPPPSGLPSDFGIPELMPVSSGLTPERIVSSLDVGCFLTMTGHEYPPDLRAIIALLEENCLIHRSDEGRYSITLLGAILFCRDLTEYSRLMCKTVRIVKYIGSGKSKIERQIELTKGYAVQWEQLQNCVDLLLPSHEEIRGGFMVPIRAYPPKAVREAILNALMHQDLSDEYHGVIVEIFDDRVVITHPSRSNIGNPTDPTNRLLSEMMCSAGMRESVSTGLDEVIRAFESENLPVPEVRIGSSFTKVTLFGEEPFDPRTPAS